jgi:hypothetical protein
MSYVRQSQCDVYLFEHCGGYFQCCNCILKKLPEWKHDAATRAEMIAHLREHEAAGHDTGGAIKMLEDEIVSGWPEPRAMVRS